MTRMQEIRESYLQDIQILRNRGLSVPSIAEELSTGERIVHRRQVDRWVKELKKEQRWRSVVFGPSGFAEAKRNQRRGYEQ